MELRLEVVPLPVADVDRAKAFYVDQVGFACDHDVAFPGLRVCQLTPSGSACSIVLGVVTTPPGSVQGLHLVVADLDAAVADLASRGVALDDVVDHGGGVRSCGFSDPDGNGWLLQEVAADAHIPEV